MIIIKENNKIYKLQLRNSYNHIKSEKKFRNLIEKTIKNYESIYPEYGKILRKKSLFEICSIFGILTNK